MNLSLSLIFKSEIISIYQAYMISRISLWRVSEFDNFHIDILPSWGKAEVVQLPPSLYTFV